METEASGLLVEKGVRFHSSVLLWKLRIGDLTMNGRRPNKTCLNFLARLAGTVGVMLLALSVSEVAWACPTCKESLAANDPHYQNLVAGYFYSILFMMSMPFVLLSSFSTYMYVEVRRARKAKAAQASPPQEPLAD